MPLDRCQSPGCREPRDPKNKFGYCTGHDASVRADDSVPVERLDDDGLQAMYYHYYASQVRALTIYAMGLNVPPGPAKEWATECADKLVELTIEMVQRGTEKELKRRRTARGEGA